MEEERAEAHCLSRPGLLTRSAGAQGKGCAESGPHIMCTESHIMCTESHMMCRVTHDVQSLSHPCHTCNSPWPCAGVSKRSRLRGRRGEWEGEWGTCTHACGRTPPFTGRHTDKPAPRMLLLAGILLQVSEETSSWTAPHNQPLQLYLRGGGRAARVCSGC